MAYDISLRHLTMCLERSSPYPVHLHLPLLHGPLSAQYKSKLLMPIIPASSRVTCLWTYNTYSYSLLRTGLPNLTMLNLEFCEHDITPSLFSCSNFPSLRSLNSGRCLWVSSSSGDTSELSPLEYLVISNNTGIAWTKAVQKCSRTLRGLKVYLSHKNLDVGQETVHFPVLEYLKIEEFGFSNSWPIQAITPMLSDYDEGLTLPQSQLTTYVTVKNVKLLRSHNIHHLHSLSSLEVFQLRTRSAVLVTLVKELEEFEELCPNLRRIEFNPSQSRKRKMNRVGPAERALKAARPHIEFVRLDFTQWFNLPGSQNEYKCGH